MLQKGWFLALLLVIPLKLFAEEHALKENGVKLYVSPSFGLLSGQGEELVYRNKGSDDTVSQLLWHMNPLVYTGFDVYFDWEKLANKWGAFADASFKFGMPMKSGKTEDRDWMNSRYADFLTHYSVHDNKTDAAIMIYANSGVAFAVFNKHLLKAYLAYEYMSFSWTASGGSFLYPKYPDGSEGHGYLTTPTDVGTYKQAWHMFSPALSFYGTFNRYFSAEIALQASPFIWCHAVDNHILRKLVITDTLNGGFYSEPKFVLLFTPKEWFSLAATVSYTHISGTRGTGQYDYSDRITADLTAKNMSGAGYSAFDLGLIAEFRIVHKRIS